MNSKMEKSHKKQSTVPLADRVSESESCSSIGGKRKMQQAVQAYDDRLDDIVIENYDKQYKFAGDKLDKDTDLKMQGFYD